MTPNPGPWEELSVLQGANLCVAGLSSAAVRYEAGLRWGFWKLEIKAANYYHFV